MWGFSISEWKGAGNFKPRLFDSSANIYRKLPFALYKCYWFDKFTLFCHMIKHTKNYFTFVLCYLYQNFVTKHTQFYQQNPVCFKNFFAPNLVFSRVVCFNTKCVLNFSSCILDCSLCVLTLYSSNKESWGMKKIKSFYYPLLLILILVLWVVYQVNNNTPPTTIFAQLVYILNAISKFFKSLAKFR